MIQILSWRHLGGWIALSAASAFLVLAPGARAAVTVETVPGEAPSLLPDGRSFKLIWNDEFNGTSLDDSKWYAGYIGAANGKGIVNGRSATTFDPKSNCTRGQLVIMLYRYNKLYHLVPVN